MVGTGFAQKMPFFRDFLCKTQFCTKNTSSSVLSHGTKPTRNFYNFVDPQPCLPGYNEPSPMTASARRNSAR